MKYLISLGCLIAAVSSCQQQIRPMMPVNALAFRQQAASDNLHSMPLTAKWAENESQRLSKQWSPDAVLTHVLGTAITSKGEPHASQGSWTFTYIDKAQSGKAMQLVFRLKAAPSMRNITMQQVPQTEALELRAWGLDSDRAVIKAKEVNPKVTFRYMELTAVDNGRLVWAFDKKPLLDAMHGKPYEPLRR